MVWIFFILIFFILYPYLFYPLILKIIFLFKKARYFVFNDNYFPKITLLIPAYNEGSVIKEKIKNLLEISYPKSKKEIIIISDGSTDKTAEIVKRFKNIKFINQLKRTGKIKILNKYIPKAKGEIVILSDANTFFKKDSVKNLIKYFSDKSTGSVCGNLIFKGIKGEIKYWNYENILKRLEGDIKGLFGANGGIYAIRKKYFKKIPDDTIIDDIMIPMLINSRGYEIIFSKRSTAWEYTGQTWKEEFKRRRRIGFGNLQILYYLFKKIIKLKGIKLFTFSSHKIIRWMAPVLMAFLFIINIFLIENIFFLITFIMQLFVFINAVFFNNILSYFIRMNFALLTGYIRFIRGKSEGLW